MFLAPISRSRGREGSEEGEKERKRERWQIKRSESEGANNGSKEL